MEGFEHTLRRLAIRDDRFFDQVLGSEEGNLLASCLEPKSHALVQIGALIAVNAAPQSFSICVDSARHAGATAEEIVGTLVAAVPILGAPRIVSVAPNLGLALGYDIDGALESDGQHR